MTVNRVSATLARTQEKPYTTLLNDSLALIDNVDSMAVYVYLQTKAEGWKVRRTDVMNRFNIGKDKYTKALGHLKEIGLVETVIVRDEKGKVLDNQLVIHYQPYIDTRETEKPDVGENRMSDNPNVGKQGHLVINQSIKNESTNINNSCASTDALESAFDLFWLSGMKKVNKKKAFSAFKTQFKNAKPKLKTDNKELEFANYLVRDVQKRLQVGQLGFDSMHPTTYLNGERWNDEVVLPSNIQRSESLALQTAQQQKADNDRDWQLQQSSQHLTKEEKQQGIDNLKKLRESM